MSKKKITRKAHPVICGMTGSICISLSGRDAGNLMVVLGRSENGYVYVADGRSRKICAPKLKNSKHISVISQTVGGVYEMIANGCANDALIKRAISSAAKEILC